MKQNDERNMDKLDSDKLSQGFSSKHAGAEILTGRKKDADYNVELTAAATKNFTKSVEASEDLVKRAKDATEAMDYLCTHIKTEWMQYDEFLTKALVKARATKVALEIETRQTIAALRDVREFFLEDKHQAEVARLKEFVTLCDRLRDLKSSGFLDTVADTILKLS